MLAQLGLCRYQSTIVRDPELFSGATSRGRRSEHLVARLAFTQELWSTYVGGPATLYRAAAVDGPLPERAPASFVSCTFSETVAAAHFGGGPSTETSVLWRQQVGLARSPADDVSRDPRDECRLPRGRGPSDRRP